ncbi:DUF6612 family protein [uncultured Dysosmobacter sp.]|uniref:DUF6612 family protein n=1 Tax=uncultured Dysosmobacter sp. TaxID=2591384 RepID=UPI002626B043|nr:S-layer homology domain-containing protein [uncultured Dysosmobacter sp.]
MKRFLTILFTTLLLTAALCVTASASDYDAVAEDLSAIGMFRGTASGFELDRAPTRSEAAIMLVRLYGAEDDAKAAYEAGEIKHPFTDVSDFAAPYVAWVYTNGISNGTGADTFGSASKCSLQNYAVFLLRALGYKDGTDFQYADALTFAQSKGFYEPVMFSGDFLRDDLAALTYQALAADMADGKTYLLDSLVTSGAIDAKAAQPMTDKITAYRAMESATAGMDSDAMDVDIAMDMDVTMGGIKMPTKTTGNMKVAAESSDIQMACTMKTIADGETMDIGMWMKDGWMYMSMGADGETMNVKYPVDDQTAAMESMEIVDVEAMNVSGLAMIDSITAKKSGSDTVYTVVMGRNLGGMMDNALGMMGQEASGLSMDISDITAAYTVGSNGKLKSVAMVFSAAMKMDLPLEDGQTLSMDVAYDYDMTMQVNALGKDVKIVYPDFSKFQEVDPDSLTAA